jgi:hypothetical protein
MMAPLEKPMAMGALARLWLARVISMKSARTGRIGDVSLVYGPVWETMAMSWRCSKSVLFQADRDKYLERIISCVSTNSPPKKTTRSPPTMLRIPSGRWSAMARLTIPYRIRRRRRRPGA